MEKSSSKAHLLKEAKSAKLVANPSKNKKEPRQTSSKNIKLLKSPPSKAQLPPEDNKIKQQTSPSNTNRTLADNDYGVSTFYAKYKVKTSKKKEF